MNHCDIVSNLILDLSSALPAGGLSIIRVLLRRRERATAFCAVDCKAHTYHLPPLQLSYNWIDISNALTFTLNKDP